MKVLVDINTVNEAMLAIRTLNDDEFDYVYSALEQALNEADE